MSQADEFRYGPDGIPFHLIEGGSVVDVMGRIPFHGIISRGLLERVQQGTVNLSAWEQYAHQLHDITAADSEELMGWRGAAAECGMLSFAQSAACVRSYVEQYAPANRHCEMWQVKEGHTSSVWRVRLESANSRLEFALNVARDRAGGEELERTSGTMQRIAALWGEANLARVLDVRRVPLAKAAEGVVVTRNQWIADSFELHHLPGRAGGLDVLVAVERFLTEDTTPARICWIVGRRLARAERERVEQDLEVFRRRTAGLGVDVDIAEGDLVWNGERAWVVAIR